MSNQSLNINENFLQPFLSSRQHPFPMNTVCHLMSLILWEGTVGLWPVNYQYDKAASGLWVLMLVKNPNLILLFSQHLMKFKEEAQKNLEIPNWSDKPRALKGTMEAEWFSEGPVDGMAKVYACVKHSIALTIHWVLRDYQWNNGKNSWEYFSLLVMLNQESETKPEHSSTPEKK